MSNNIPVTNDFEIRTYKLRRSRVTASQAQALETLRSKFVLDAGDSKIDLRAETGRSSWVVEIGFGMGEATVALAQAQPAVAVLAIDVHTPGVGKLLHQLEEHNLDNVRVIEGDALHILRGNIVDGSLTGVRLFFPDPWPKARHHKRRFIQTENLTLVAEKVQVGGFLHIATDWENYAEHALENLAQLPQWEILEPGLGVELAQPSERPRTRFEQRGIDAGRKITDIVAVRRS